MHEEDNIDESLLAPADEDYDIAPSSPLGNPYTQLTFPESSPPAIPLTRHHSNSLIMPPSTQGSADWDLQLSHRQPSSTAASAQRVVRSSTEDDSFEVTAPPPSQFTKVDPNAKPAPARTKPVLSQYYLYFFLRLRY